MDYVVRSRGESRRNNEKIFWFTENEMILERRPDLSTVFVKKYRSVQNFVNSTDLSTVFVKKCTDLSTVFVKLFLSKTVDKSGLLS